MRNPRYPGKSLPSLSAAADKAPAVKPSDIFAIEPPVIEFNDFEIGAIYELTVGWCRLNPGLKALGFTLPS